MAEVTVVALGLFGPHIYFTSARLSTSGDIDVRSYAIILRVQVENDVRNGRSAAGHQSARDGSEGADGGWRVLAGEV
jgi:hypothetical protein